MYIDRVKQKLNLLVWREEFRTTGSLQAHYRPAWREATKRPEANLNFETLTYINDI